MMEPLTPEHLPQKSFGNKAHHHYQDGRRVLYSYNQPIAVAMQDGTLYINFNNDNWDTPTTLRHIKEFNMQYGTKKNVNKKQLEEFPAWEMEG